MERLRFLTETLIKVGKIYFQDFALEILDTHIKITLLIQKEPEFMVMVTRPFEAAPDIPDGHIVFSVFKGDEQISGVMPLADFSDRMAQYTENISE